MNVLFWVNIFLSEDIIEAWSSVVNFLIVIVSSLQLKEAFRGSVCDN